MMERWSDRFPWIPSTGIMSCSETMSSQLRERSQSSPYTFVDVIRSSKMEEQHIRYRILLYGCLNTCWHTHVDTPGDSRMKPSLINQI